MDANERKLRDTLANIDGSAFTVRFTETIFDNGDRFFVPVMAAHRSAAQRILNKALFEPATHALVASVLKVRPGNIVHAGTFFGDMLPSFARACPKMVYAFEPVLENYVLAKLCIEANNLENVILTNAGLGTLTATAKIDTGIVDENHRGGASAISDGGQRTAIVNIDMFNLTDVSVIQLDVEGYELPALRGASQTIERCGPVVMIEDKSGNCADYLRQLEYIRCGRIPGLEIWSRPADKKRVTELVKATRK